MTFIDMVLIICALVAYFYKIFVIDKESESLVMDDNGTLIVVLQEFDKGNELYYVHQTCDPYSAISYEDEFMSNISFSEVYSDRNRAVNRAKELEQYSPTCHGILVFDALSPYTLGEIMSKFEYLKGVTHYNRTIH
jgi:hypothetical protein